MEAEAQRLVPLWNERRGSGRVRECHGDLHLANAIALDGDVTAFDGIEFDAALRWIDVLADIAFLVMDLAAHGRRDLAARCLNAYLDASGDHAGVPTMRFFMAYRALVRAEVGLLREAQGGRVDGPPPRAYFALARELGAPGSARLLITHGLPGSGKSFLAQALLERCGAIRLRSDVERKRMFGLAALDDSRARGRVDIYGGDATRRTYERMHALARVALQSGWPTIVDAAFLRRSERDRFAALASEVGAPFAILDCRAPLSLLRERVAARVARGDDPSEADLVVLERLAVAVQPLDDTERAYALTADAEQPIDAVGISATWMSLR
jgi:predicted kinase